MIKFIASNLTSVELKKFDKTAMSMKFPRVIPVYFNMWKYRLDKFHLSHGEVEAFLKGKYAVGDEEATSNGFERSIMIALYQYYRQSDSIKNSALKAEKVTNFIFWNLGWPTYEMDKDNGLGSTFQ